MDRSRIVKACAGMACALMLLVMQGRVHAQVRGYVDGTFANASGGYIIRGWACQTGYDQSINVHVYVGGPAGVGTYAGAGTANVASEPGVATQCQAGGTAYRFNLPLTAAAREQHQGKLIYVHGISLIGSGNLVISQSGLYRVPGPVAAVRRYVYNGYQELCKFYEPESGTTVMGYDGAGNLAWSAAGLNLTSHNSCNESNALASGRVVTRGYDARNRLKTLTFPGGDGNQTWTYTPDGLPASIATTMLSDPRIITNQYAYNRRRQLAHETQSLTGWGTYTLSYQYNANGHLASLAYPAGYLGPIVDYAPNALGQPTKAGTFASAVTYFPNGAIKSFTYGNGVKHTLTQNLRGLPDTSCDFASSCNTAAILNDGYDYDQNGNVAAISDGRTGNRGDRTMTYDPLDRLTQAVSPMFGTATYAYDALDNLTRVKVTAGNKIRDHYYCYDEAKWQLTNVKTGSCSGTTVMGLGYDVQGNLANQSGVTYKFDYGNRLREVVGKENQFLYDGLGRRVLSNRLVNGSSARRSIYSQAGQLLFVQDQGEAKRKDYFYLGGSLIAERVLPNSGAATPVAIRYQHTDALGSPVAITNESKAVVEKTEYEPYGRPANRLARSGPGYTGHAEDAATGLTYMQQRYYDPGIGRFLSVDPVAAYTRPGANFNRYWYANNNPYRFTDPDGRAAKWIQHKDGTHTLEIKIVASGSGASDTLASQIESATESLQFQRSDVKIDVQFVDKGGRGINKLDLSPGNGPCPDSGCVNRLGGNKGHADSSRSDVVNVAKHEILHFAGIDEAYVEGPKDANGNRTSTPKTGYDKTNIMADRRGNTLKDGQLDEARANRSTKKEWEK